MRPWRFCRCAVNCAAAVFFAVTAASHALAQSSDYPTRPIRMIVPIAPGGGVDTMARTIGPLLNARIGQPVVIDNRSGGGGSVGAELTAQAIADGHTIMLASSAFVLHSL